MNDSDTPTGPCAGGEPTSERLAMDLPHEPDNGTLPAAIRHARYDTDWDHWKSNRDLG